jgi:hypothetical protein
VTVFERLRMPSPGGATEWLSTEPLGTVGHTADAFTDAVFEVGGAK